MERCSTCGGEISKADVAAGYKTCARCRENGKVYRKEHKEEIKQYRKEYYRETGK